jgi:glutathione S-transferase
MSKPYLHYAWQMSYYSGKTRAYLRYKGIPHVEKIVRLWTMATIQKKVGAQVMPVVVTPEGQWLQDTSSIIDLLEQRFPDAPVVPATPKQKLAAYLFEIWGDEFWVASAMHYRWSFDENYQTLFRREGGDQLLPFAPRFLKNQIADRISKMLRGFCRGLGVVPAQIPQVERWTHQHMDALDAHFTQHPYLLGSKPSLGDFGLIGPLYAHLGRDPVPARELIAPRKHLAAWIARMQNPPTPQGGEFLPNDEVPATLDVALRSVFGELWPQLVGTIAECQKALPTLPPDRGFARSLAKITIPFAGEPYRLGARPYTLWMAQRLLDVYRAFTPAEQATVQAWLAPLGGDQAMQLEVPRLKRLALHVAPA